MKKQYFSLAALLMFAVHITYGNSDPSSQLTPEEALTRLKEGNERFVSGNIKNPNQSEDYRVHLAKEGQSPFATILACADSRQAVSVVFDHGLGDLFVIRVAGNVASEDEAGSIEYAVDHLATPLVVVLGHTQCGAVSAVVDRAKTEDNLKRLLDKIQPAVDQTRMQYPDLKGQGLAQKAVEGNVYYSVEQLLKNSPTIRKHVMLGKIMLVGAIYNLEKGTIEWLGEHPRQEKILESISKPKKKRSYN